MHPPFFPYVRVRDFPPLHRRMPFAPPRTLIHGVPLLDWTGGSFFFSKVRRPKHTWLPSFSGACALWCVMNQVLPFSPGAVWNWCFLPAASCCRVSPFFSSDDSRWGRGFFSSVTQSRASLLSRVRPLHPAAFCLSPPSVPMPRSRSVFSSFFFFTGSVERFS